MRLSVSRSVEGCRGCRGCRACRSVSSVSSGCRVLSRCLASKVSRYPRWQDAVAAHNKTWAAAAKLFHPLVAASQSCTPVDVAQPVSTTSILCAGHLRTSSSLVPGVIATAQGAVQAQHLRLQHTPCSSVAAASSSPLQRSSAQSATDNSDHGTGWCHESVDIATAQGAVQQLRATVPHRSSVAAAAASPLQRRQCTKRNGPQVCTHGTSSLV